MPLSFAGSRNFSKSKRYYARTSGHPTNFSYDKIRTFFNLSGLNTAVDDLHKGESESPYMYNVRPFGEDEVTQRAPIMGRTGAEMLCDSDLMDRVPLDLNDGDNFIEIYEGKAIDFVQKLDGSLFGLEFAVENTGGAKGYIRVSLRDVDTDEDYMSGVIDLCNLTGVGFNKQLIKFIDCVELEQQEVRIRLEVVDDVNPESCFREDPIMQRRVRILATGAGNHRTSEFSTPNLDQCRREVQFEWTDALNAPLIGTLTSEYRAIPGMQKVCCDGKDYLMYTVKGPNGVYIFRADMKSGACRQVGYADPRSEAVRYEQCGDVILVVDGYSPLRSIACANWAITDAIPDTEDIRAPGSTQEELLEFQEELTAKPGASLIKKYYSRIFLAGFKDDPGYVEFSFIDSEGPKYDQFNDGFYAGDEEASAATCKPITALACLDDYMFIFNQEGKFIFHAPGGFDAGSPSQRSARGEDLGVLSQEAVTEGVNNIYFYNPTEGPIRCPGENDVRIGLKVKNQFDAIPREMRKDVVVVYHDLKVHYYYHNEGNHNNKSLIYYTTEGDNKMWVRDNNTPALSAYCDEPTDMLYLAHSCGPIIYKSEVAKNYKDFDTEICVEYSTRYDVGKTPSAWIYLHEVYAHVLANYTQSYYIGIDIDYQDNPAVWRKFSRANLDSDNNPDAVFQNTAESGIQVLSMSMNMKAHYYQIRMKTYQYAKQAEIVGVEIRWGDKESL